MPLLTGSTCKTFRPTGESEELEFADWTRREARRLDKARRLLRPAIPEDSGGVWADLGCGEGIFTYHLAALLQPGSKIHAVDKDRRRLQSLERIFEQ